MKRISPYLKLQVIAAIDYSEGKTRRERIRKVSKLTFKDEYGNPMRFTWRTISTWYCRYKKHGYTSIEEKKRSDTGLTRKTAPEELQEAINLVLPHFKGNHANKMEVYRKIISKGIISQKQLAQTTFYRLIREYELLNNDSKTNNKRRLAFAMQYANELWQMDTMYGPYIKDEDGKSIQTKLIAIIDDALCNLSWTVFLS